LSSATPQSNWLRSCFLLSNGSSQSGLLVAIDDVIPSPLGLGRLVAVEDATEVAGHFRTSGHLGHSLLRLSPYGIGTAATAPQS